MPSNRKQSFPIPGNQSGRTEARHQLTRERSHNGSSLQHDAAPAGSQGTFVTMGKENVKLPSMNRQKNRETSTSAKEFLAPAPWPHEPLGRPKQHRGHRQMSSTAFSGRQVSQFTSIIRGSSSDRRRPFSRQREGAEQVKATSQSSPNTTHSVQSTQPSAENRVDQLEAPGSSSSQREETVSPARKVLPSPQSIRLESHEGKEQSSSNEYSHQGGARIGEKAGTPEETCEGESAGPSLEKADNTPSGDGKTEVGVGKASGNTELPPHKRFAMKPSTATSSSPPPEVVASLATSRGNVETTEVMEVTEESSAPRMNVRQPSGEQEERFSSQQTSPSEHSGWPGSVQEDLVVDTE